jgi:two-component system sensor histidine kinase RegB
MARKVHPTADQRPDNADAERRDDPGPAVGGGWLAHLAARTASKGADLTFSDPDVTNRKNMALLIQLRWIAVVGQIITIATVQFGLGIDLPVASMALVLTGLIALNLTSYAWLRGQTEVTGRALLLVLVLDMAALTAQLWFSGGAINPFTSLFLLQVMLGAVLLDAVSTWILVGLACLGVVGLTFSYRPLVVNGDMFALHRFGMLACFVLDAVLLVVFVTRVTQNLRDRDTNLAALRQHALEEDHIVRMGLLATGAAHELGTPLASVSVILGDWRRMPQIASDAGMVQELDEMETAVKRCKSILTGILLSAGEARGEASEATTLDRFIDAIVREWRRERGTDVLRVQNRLRGSGLRVAFDTVVKQAIFNVLDNALEASPGFIQLTVRRQDDRLVFQVADAGPGFSEEMLAQIGRPYQSCKGRPGSGLGLFLVVNVLRKLGGTVAARNLPGGGAEVTLELPLETLSITVRGHGGPATASHRGGRRLFRPHSQAVL